MMNCPSHMIRTLNDTPIREARQGPSPTILLSETYTSILGTQDDTFRLLDEKGLKYY